MITKLYRMVVLQTAVCAFAVLLPAIANAELIRFTHQGTGTGQLDSVPFGPSDFVITALGDTDDIVTFGSGYSILHLYASIAIDGVGPASFVTPTDSFVNNNNRTVGFSRGPPESGDLLNGPTNSAFTSWDMQTSIGPFSGAGTLLQWDASPVITDRGVLVFEDADSDVTFQAEIVPEPLTTQFMLCLGLVGIFLFRCSLSNYGLSLTS